MKRSPLPLGGTSDTALRQVERVQDAILDVPGVQQLLAHKAKVGAGGLAGGRPGVGASGVKVEARVISAGEVDPDRIAFQIPPDPALLASFWQI